MLILLALQEKGKNFCMKPPPPPLLWKIEVESRRKTREFYRDDVVIKDSEAEKPENKQMCYFFLKKILCRRRKLINGHDEDELPAAEKPN